jgi:hypothetical protein
LVLYVYAVTLFVSAFILFLVQPLIGKMILPKLGGTPQVWNTCMVFFQMVLLAGYAYTHLIASRLKLRQQIMLHCVLVALPVLVLFNPWVNIFNLYVSVENGGWSPGNLGGNPIPATLVILLRVIGLPFLVVSTTAPLLQKWFAHTGHPASRDPYFLYGASNLGSLLALVAYPVVIEPALGLSSQSWLWAFGYFGLIGTLLACVGFAWGPASREEELAHAHAEHPPLAAEAAVTVPAAESATAVTASAPTPGKPTGIRPGKKGPQRGGGGGGHHGRPTQVAPTPSIAVPPRSVDHIDALRRLRWVALAAIPSSLMLGITTHITTDLSPIPLFWVIPLALYLLTFILVFARWPFNWIEHAHPIVLYVQPVAICAMLFVDMIPTTQTGVLASILCNMIGFFATTLACHGELAKDRPSTRYLTEFYLWMSVGGMVGGMFNALFAPLVFKWGLAELPIAIFAACLLRPKMRETGWTDDIVAGVLEPAPETPVQGPHGRRPQRPHAAAARAGATPQMAYTLDVILPVCVLLLSLLLAFVMGDALSSLAVSMAPRNGAAGMKMFLTFGVPLMIACFYFGRPLRFGLAVGAVMLVHYMYSARGDTSEYNDRSFFGIISVKHVDSGSAQRQVGVASGFRQLLHGTTNHGMNFEIPTDQEDVGNPEKDFSRLATTYYHRLGPAGRVMEQYNWFPNTPDNRYWADARMPCAIIGNLMGDLAGGVLPTASLVNMWSEPPYATVGLGTGTMASYGRPFQHVHYYEIDNHIRVLSLPRKAYYHYYDDDPGGKRYFTYLHEAIERGSEVQVLMGDARLRMALPYGNFAEYMRDEKKYLAEHNNEPPGGPEGFYHMMVVDAFSSDAIPAHLITKEAIRMYFKHLSEEGILCVHTSNRYVVLPRVVAAVTLALNDELSAEEKAQGYNFACMRAHDQAPDEKTGHFTSEWVMVARKPAYLQRIKALEPEGYMEQLRAWAAKKGGRVENYWTSLNPQLRFLWTDNYYTLWPVLRRAGDED